MTEPEGDFLRATDWAEYVGQEAHKASLAVRVEAACIDVRPLDHMLIMGPPGTGKTTLARIIASLMNDPFMSLVMPVKPAVFVRELRQFEGGVLFLDEIHRLPKAQQEDLLTLLEEGYFQTPLGRRVDIPWLTVIAATTEPEKVTPALYQRFVVPIKLDPYSIEEMTTIVIGMALKAEVDIDNEMAAALGKAAGGIPRIARQLVLAARDLERVQGAATLQEVLRLCRLEENGLSQNHVEYLAALRALGGSAGLTVLSTMLRLHETVVRDVERLLVDRGLILYGERGRELTNTGWAYGRTLAKRPE